MQHQEDCSEDGLAASEDSIQQAITASQDWSRIVRRPRKRKGHVIVDLCTAAGWQRQPACNQISQFWGVLFQEEQLPIQSFSAYLDIVGDEVC